MSETDKPIEVKLLAPGTHVPGATEPVSEAVPEKPIEPVEPPKTNPNGANQYTLDPRQRLCWESYINPRSETFGNATQSAIKAGYEEAYAKQITVSDWFIAKLRRLNLLGKAERVLEEMVEMPVQTLEWEGHGEDAEQVVTTNPSLVKVKQDTAKFLAERLGKNEGYSSRSEITGKDGDGLVVTVIKYASEPRIVPVESAPAQPVINNGDNPTPPVSTS